MSDFLFYFQKHLPLSETDYWFRWLLISLKLSVLMFLCSVPGNSVNHSYQSKTQEQLVVFQKKKINLTFQTFCRPCAFPWLMTETLYLFAGHCILNNKHLNMQQEDVKDGYILVKDGYLPDFVSSSLAHPGPTGFLLFTLSMKYLTLFDFHPSFCLRVTTWKDWQKG